MNATTTRPEVTAFLDRVRQQLGDLDDEQREELLDGLEADLSEQLAAGDALPEPIAYAAELRSAAGLAGRTRRLPRLSQLPRVDGSLLDRARERWTRATAYHPLTRQAWTIAEAMRPAWWVLRAWIAVTLVDQLTGQWEHVTLLPTLGVPLLGPVLLLGAIVVSVLIGLGRLWPGSGPDRPLLARLVLVALNTLAVLAPLSFSAPPQQSEVYVQTVSVPYHQERVLRFGRDVVRNIYAYDAQGQPLEGVQLFDQAGRPVAVAPYSSMGSGKTREVTCPWFNGATPLYNVFPLPQRTQYYGTCLHESPRAGAQAFHAPPLASVPPATTPVTTPVTAAPVTPTDTP